MLGPVIEQDEWDREDVAWAAGIFEGEGCFCLVKRSDRRPEAPPQATANMRMTDEDVVRRFHSIVGRGTVYKCPPAKTGTKPFWQWAVKGHKDVLYITRLFWPWLGERRRGKAKEVVLGCGRPGTNRHKATSRILDLIVFERLRQDEKWGPQQHDPMTWLVVLGEEVGEACQGALRAHFGGTSLEEYQEELLQVAAVAVAALECLERSKYAIQAA